MLSSFQIKMINNRNDSIIIVEYIITGIDFLNIEIKVNENLL